MAYLHGAWLGQSPHDFADRGIIQPLSFPILT